jgi:hypothetical protein
MALESQGAVRRKPDVVSVIVETGADEAMMVGTTTAFVRLAHQILEIVNGDAPRGHSVAGVTVRWDSTIAECFDQLAEIVPSSLALVETDPERELLRQYFEAISPRQ